MRLISLTVFVIVLLLASSCQSSSLPTSSLTIRDAATDSLISASEAQGTLTLGAGTAQQIKVMRTYTNAVGNTQTDEVTQFTNFKWESGAAFATVDQLGNISGIAAGIAVMEAKFRADPLDPWDICKLTVEVT